MYIAIDARADNASVEHTRNIDHHRYKMITRKNKIVKNVKYELLS